MVDEAQEAMVYGPGMDARSTRVAERLNTPMLIAAALTIPAVAINESHPRAGMLVVAQALNWIIWTAFLIELVDDALRSCPTAAPGCATTRST